MRGSYAYVTATFSYSLVVVDVSNPASPVIRGSVTRASLLEEARGIAVSGSYVYAVGHFSDSLVVVDVSNPASPVIRGSVVSSSLMDGVRVTQSRVRPVRHARVHGATACLFTVALSLVRSHVLCTQACGVAVSGSYAYMTAHNLHSLVVVDVSNPASPVIRGSVVSSSLLGGVRVRPGASRARM